MYSGVARGVCLFCWDFMSPLMTFMIPDGWYQLPGQILFPALVEKNLRERGNPADCMLRCLLPSSICYPVFILLHKVTRTTRTLGISPIWPLTSLLKRGWCCMGSWTMASPVWKIEVLGLKCQTVGLFVLMPLNLCYQACSCDTLPACCLPCLQDLLSCYVPSDMWLNLPAEADLISLGL